MDFCICSHQLQDEVSLMTIVLGFGLSTNCKPKVFFNTFYSVFSSLHFQCYPKSPPYPPPHSPTHPLPLFGPGIPCTGAYKVCLSNGPLFPGHLLIHMQLESRALGYWLVHNVVPPIGLQTPLAPWVLD